MYWTGFADEAHPALERQIEATRALGWRHIEARTVQVDDFPAANIHDIPDAAFDRLVARLEAAGVAINCFGSTIANWGKRIDDPCDTSLAELERALPRMRRLGATLLRVMSFAVRPEKDQREAERFRRLREIQRRCADAGVMAVHENCMNYGGMGWPFTLQLLDAVPGLKLVFDTGNPVFADDRAQPPPYPKQSSWEFYAHVREQIAYIHIKDGYVEPQTGRNVYTYPGAGRAEVRRILADLLARGYDGGLSIEPHMAAVFHDPTATPDARAMEIYVEYGRRMLRMVEEIRAQAGRATRDP